MLLAIDTSADYGGLALWSGGLVSELRWRSDRRQTAELLPHLSTLMSATGVTIDDISAVAATIGPGSFNGIRVGLSTAKAFALARGLPLVPVTVFEALAWPYRAIGRIGIVLSAGRDAAIAVLTPAERGTEWHAEPKIVAFDALASALDGIDVAVLAISGDNSPALPVPMIRGAAALVLPAAVAEIGEMRVATAPAMESVQPLYLRAPHITEPRARRPPMAGEPGRGTQGAR